MLPKLDEICYFYTLKFEENAYYIVECRVTHSQKLLSGTRRSKAFSYFRTLTNTRIQCLGFRASFLIYQRSREQLSTSLVFFGTQNSIRWAAEITIPTSRRNIILCIYSVFGRYFTHLARTPSISLPLVVMEITGQLLQSWWHCINVTCVCLTYFCQAQLQLQLQLSWKLRQPYSQLLQPPTHP